MIEIISQFISLIRIYKKLIINASISSICDQYMFFNMLFRILLQENIKSINQPANNEKIN